MAEEAAITNLEDVRSEVNYEISSDFEFDEEFKQDLKSLLNIPLDFIEESSEEEEIPHENVKTVHSARGDSVERQLEALFVEDSKEAKAENKNFVTNKDTGLENISDIEFDGPESGECDTSDGELPDSPSIVVTLSDMPPALPPMLQGIEDISLDNDSDVELKTKPDREVIIENRSEEEKCKIKEKRVKDCNKVKEKSGEKSKSKNKKEKMKKKSESGTNEEDTKKKLKLKKYLARLDQYRAKCLEFMNQISKKSDVKKDEKNKVRSETSKVRSVITDDTKLKSVVERVIKEKESSPQSTTSSRLDQSSHSSHSSRMDRGSYSSSAEERSKLKSVYSEKERKLKYDKKQRSISKELTEKHLVKYKKYLQLEREKCYKERMALLDNHIKAKKRHKKSESKSCDKTKENIFFEKKERPRVLSFAEFCNSRELASPEKDVKKNNVVHSIDKSEGMKEKTMLIDSLATTSTVKNDLIDHVDEDKELFITYSEIIEQDKMEENKKLEEDREKIENILEKDPELKSISVFTSVLFKGSADSSTIPFLQERRSPSPKVESFKPKTSFNQCTGPDEIYDWNDDLSNISQSTLSPSHSPVPKVHNKALLNYLENQKLRIEKRKVKSSSRKSSKSSRSRSKSPRKERLRSKKKKSKHCSSISVSPSPPPLKARSPDFKKRPSPPAYLKERWRDYPSPVERRRENYDRPSRSRRRSRSHTRHSHRSRSSSEERHYRRYRSRSRSRSRSPSPLSMVQLSGVEKRRKLLKEEHERALASLRATIRKPLSSEPLSITFKSDGDNFEAVRDNYDPVVMNEDSSSPTSSEVTICKPAITSVSELPPLPPGLPPEPPPVPPPAPAVDENKDMTVVTTYTSFVPIPNTNIAPPHHPNDMVVPMRYMNTDMRQMPAFGNWMGPPNMPMGDMGPNIQRHMFHPPPMINTYEHYNTPPQQPFSFLNQPPPPLPYQMQMPPPCNQHYRMPNQGPPPNINLISVRQEIKNIKSNPVVITQIPDSPEIEPPQNLPKSNLTHPVDSNNKCKHNASGENNQSIQEAIDNVKKCLKNSDGMKHKDPRLAPLEMRNKSPEKSEEMSLLNKDNSQGEDKKVKITLNFKPRPVTSVEQTCVFESESDIESDKKSPEPDDLSKIPKQDICSEKTCKIEGIVSKLKDTFNQNESIEKNKNLEISDIISECPEKCVIEPPNNVVVNNERQKLADELYDPFNTSDENIEDLTSSERTTISNNENQHKTTFKFELKLSEGEVKEINNKIDNCFAFILSHSIDRKRLTPTLDSISAKKTDEFSSCSLKEKCSPISKPCHMLNFVQKDKKNIQSKAIEVSSSVATTQNDSKNKNVSLNTPQKVSRKENKEQFSLYTPRIQFPKSDIESFQHVFKKDHPKQTEEIRFNTDLKMIMSSKLSNNIKEANSDCLQLKNLETNDNEMAQVKPIKEIENDTSKKHIFNEQGNNASITEHSNLKTKANECIIQMNSDEQKVEHSEKTICNEYSKENLNCNKNHKSDLEERKESPRETIEIKNEINKLDKNNKDNIFGDELSEPKVSSNNRETNLDISSKNSNETDQSSHDIRSNKCDKNVLSIPQNSSIEANSSKVGASKEEASSDVRDHPNTVRRTVPLLTIPTKGELKRFPTPETDLSPTEKTLELIQSNEGLPLSNEEVDSAIDNISLRSDKGKIEEKIVHPGLPKTVVESIIHDFEDSNSTEPDFQLMCKEKGKKLQNEEVIQQKLDDSVNEITDTNNSNLDQYFSEGKAIVSEVNEYTLSHTSVLTKEQIEMEDGLDNTKKSDTIKKIESFTTILKNSTSKDICSSEDTDDKKVSVNVHIIDAGNQRTNKSEREVNEKDRKLNKDNVVTNIDNNISTETVGSPSSYISNEKNVNNEKENTRIHVQFLSKGLKAESNGNKETETCLKNTKNEKLDYIQENVQRNSLIEDTSSISLDTNPNLIKPGSSHKVPMKPCPLSKKSKSFISKNLPTTFHLSVDGHLIRRGFKKLQVHIIKIGATMPGNQEYINQTENMSSAEDTTNHISVSKNNKNDCKFNLDLVNTSCSEIKKICSLGNIEIKQQSIQKKKRQTKKRVSFNMNVNEILENSEILCSEKVKPTHNEKDTSARKKFISDETKNTDFDNDNEGYRNLNRKCDKAALDVDSLNNFIAVHNECIMKTLNSFQTMPLSQLCERKSLVIRIPKAEDMPEIKIRDSPKKMSYLKSKKKLDLQEKLNNKNDNIQQKNIEIHHQQLEKENCSKLISDPEKRSETNRTLGEVLKNNNSRCTEENDSDNDDSVILDKELSDLAKGCLDSDSTVGGDDDSVLNFGIATLDETSRDSDFNPKWKNTISRFSSNQQNKISSPQNMKKRFSKKIKSLCTEPKTKYEKKNGVENTTEEINLNSIQESEKESVTNVDLLLNEKKVSLNESELEVSPERLGQQICIRNHEIVNEKTSEISDSAGIKDLENKSADKQEIKNYKVEDMKEEHYESLDNPIHLDQKIINVDSVIKDKKLQLLPLDSDEKLNKTEIAAEITSVGKDIYIKENIHESSYTNLGKIHNNLEINTNHIKKSEQKENLESAKPDAFSYNKESKSSKSCIIDKVEDHPNSFQKELCEDFEKKYEINCKASTIKILNENNTETDYVVEENRVKAENLNEKSSINLLQLENNEKLGASHTKKTSYTKNDEKKSTSESNEHIIQLNHQVLIEDCCADKPDGNETPTLRRTSRRKLPEKGILPCLETRQINNKQDIRTVSPYNNEAEELTSKISVTKTGGESGELKEISEFSKNCKSNKICKVEVKKIEADSSTSFETVTDLDTVRKTRSGQRRIPVYAIVNKVEKPSIPDKSESSSKKCKSENNVYEICKTNESKEGKVCEDRADGNNDLNDSELNIKEDKLDMKQPQIVSRTLSTESFDEPLIFVKEKLLANKKEECQEEVQTKISKNFKEDMIITKIDNIVQNECIENKIKSCVSHNAANTGHTSRQEGKLNEEKSFKNKTNDTNESETNLNQSPNADPNDKMYSSSTGVTSSGTINSKAKLNTSPLTKNNINLTFKNPLKSQLFQDDASLIRNSAIQTKLPPKKKRLKVDVNAEIKKRLAEIDELEKQALNQHVASLEEIGARTRSRTLITDQNKFPDDDNDDEDVVSISSDDSHNTSLDTNDAGTACTLLSENKAEYPSTEEPSTTKEYRENTTKIHDEDTIQKESKLENVCYDAVSTHCSDSIRLTRSKLSIESDIDALPKIQGTAPEESPKQLDNHTELSTQSLLVTHINPCAISCEKDYSNSDIRVSSSPSTINIKKVKGNGRVSVISKSTQEESNFTRKSSLLLVNQSMITRRNKQLLQPFKENNCNPEQKKEISPIPNWPSKRKQSLGKKRGKTNVSNLALLELPSDLNEGSARKTQNTSVLDDTVSEKSNNCSRDSSPPPLKHKKDILNFSEESLPDFKLEAKLSIDTITEPDSSTTTLIKVISPISTNVEKSIIDAKTEALSARTNTHLNDQNSIESTHSNISQALNMTGKSVDIFRRPYRKSLVNRKRRRRRPFLGKYLSTSSRPLAPTINVTNSLNENIHRENIQSEDVVSSSVSTIQLPPNEAKKKRRRKTVMDLLMEDSMLSVTRDFPMSPNPYVLPSFYKEIDLSNSSHKINPCNVNEQDISKKPTGNHEFPPKSDMLSQKLRLLEKLKSINRKNRKTRQCRTLVCYNEDSLPESLVESPVSESIHSTSEGGTLVQEFISIKNNQNDCEQNSLKEVSETTSLTRSHQHESDCDSEAKITGHRNLRKNRQDISLSKIDLKRVRRHRPYKSVYNKNNNSELKNICSDTPSTSGNVMSLEDDNLSESHTRIVVTENNNSMITVKESDNGENRELTGFNKLLEKKSNDATKLQQRNYCENSIPSSNIFQAEISNNVLDKAFDSFNNPLRTVRDLSENEENSESGNFPKDICYIRPDGSHTNLKLREQLQPTKILCSILKVKIGKMLPYFGNSSSDDDEDLDENIPLAIKLSRSNEIDSSKLTSEKNKYLNSGEGEEILPLRKTQPPSTRRSVRRIKELLITSPLRKSPEKITNTNCGVTLETGICATQTKNLPHKQNVVLSSIKTSSHIRKSSRIVKIQNVLFEEKSNHQISTVLSNSKEKNEHSLMNVKLKGHYSSFDTKLNIDISDKNAKKRGRPSKPKSVVSEGSSEEKLSNVKMNDTLVEKEESSFHCNIKGMLNCEVIEHSNLNQMNDQVQRDNICNEIIQNQIKPCLEPNSDDMENEESSVIAETINTSQGSPRLELSDLDSAIQKSITLRRTRAKHVKATPDILKCNKIEINDSQQKDNENNSENERKQEMKMEEIQLNEKVISENDICLKRRGKIGKLVTLSSIRQYSPNKCPRDSDSSIEAYDQNQQKNNKKGLLDHHPKVPFNESPPFLIKTRSRRLNLRSSDNLYLTPPNLDVPFKEEIIDKVESEILSERKVDLSSTQYAKKSKKSKDLYIEEQKIETSNSAPLEPTDEIKNQKPLCNESVLMDTTVIIPKGKQTLTKKKGRKGKRKVVSKRTCTNISKKDIESDYDSEVEVNIPVLKVHEYCIDKDLKVGKSFQSQENLKTIIHKKTEEDHGSIKVNDDKITCCNENTASLLYKESRTRKRKVNERVENVLQLSILNQDKNENDERPLESDDNFSKKSKLQDDIEHTNEGRVEKTDNTPTSTNHFQDTPASTSYTNSANQVFLWNKISGFLNKTTRSVGTQVKVKNMALKGFDNSEPEVSLQSELTLPQVIKTLFEELKYLDSSFSDS